MLFGSTAYEGAVRRVGTILGIPRLVSRGAIHGPKWQQLSYQAKKQG